MSIQTKTCTSCNISKELSFFYKDKKGKFKVMALCIECSKKYYRDNCERVKQRVRQYEIDNKESISAKRKMDYIDRKESILKRNEIYRKQNIEKKAKYDRIYREKNKDLIASKRLANLEQISKVVKEYRRSERGKACINNSNGKRRSRLKNSDVNTEDILNLKNNAKNCYWCNKKLIKNKTHIDHYIPLSKGGEHILSNLVISCSTCNNKKYTKDPLVFAQSIGKLF